jgi:hypothetical protein
MKRLVSVLLEKYHVSTVIVGSVFCRRKPRGLSRRAYDRKKQKINKFLSKEFGKMDIMFYGGHTSTIDTHPAPQPLNETVPEYKCLHFVTRFK